MNAPSIVGASMLFKNRRGSMASDITDNPSPVESPKLHLKENQFDHIELKNDLYPIDEHGESNISDKHMNDKEGVAYNNFIVDAEDGKSSSTKDTRRMEDVRVTIHDYHCLSMKESIVYDKRSFKNYLVDHIKEHHRLMSLIFKTSLIHPVFIRTNELIFEMSLQFSISALLFTDTYIDDRAKNPNNVSLFINLA
jgi:hypothetical protein